ncbi:hypothetical protein KL930_005209 [Ogataea haglerorum]|uniref:Uncharacterized protein n=1 Tax=Ogataea haglerorum TaxID=1937702 RepID=A0ABQ7R9C9_9ASCO|nr:uncharacterized protein KL911_005220 [Ogataea haglerorum]KAG7691579.1 hypothetical protein KL915_005129 [Ogataea haglerorum]KAG7691976.1 hypothetical protein KL951_005180 [Ogataea haglerorum]KAG7702330.1 hypothetical protein KL914_005259 [Ogataea haglerorum]KAG7702444.1 hypothetical protein KL950_005259 [Ogataea haglerorum]KAG7713211.1 hypothetical protein KL913_005192 [Ogataea haglerorum]
MFFRKPSIASIATYTTVDRTIKLADEVPVSRKIRLRSSFATQQEAEYENAFSIDEADSPGWFCWLWRLMGWSKTEEKVCDLFDVSFDSDRFEFN